MKEEVSHGGAKTRRTSQRFAGTRALQVCIDFQFWRARLHPRRWPKNHAFEPSPASLSQALSVSIPIANPIATLTQFALHLVSLSLLLPVSVSPFTAPPCLRGFPIRAHQCHPWFPFLFEPSWLCLPALRGLPSLLSTRYSLPFLPALAVHPTYRCCLPLLFNSNPCKFPKPRPASSSIWRAKLREAAFGPLFGGVPVGRGGFPPLPFLHRHLLNGSLHSEDEEEDEEEHLLRAITISIAFRIHSPLTPQLTNDTAARPH